MRSRQLTLNSSIAAGSDRRCRGRGRKQRYPKRCNNQYTLDKDRWCPNSSARMRWMSVPRSMQTESSSVGPEVP